MNYEEHKTSKEIPLEATNGLVTNKKLNFSMILISHHKPKDLKFVPLTKVDENIMKEEEEIFMILHPKGQIKYQVGGVIEEVLGISLCYVSKCFYNNSCSVIFQNKEIIAIGIGGP
eukprot:UN21890